MRRWWVASGAAIVAALFIAQTASLEAKWASPSTYEETYKELDLFADALKIVQTDYVEEPKVKELIYGALKGMLATLDPYSQFLDPESYNELKVETEGEFGGLGIEITIRDELLTIIAPIDDTPAFHVGLAANDRIVKIDGELTRGITLMEAVKKLRGKPGTEVTLTVLREGENELKDFTIERAIIQVRSVRKAEMIDERIGYIRLSDFHENTTQDLASAIVGLKEDGMDSMILDLRNNPGGLLDVAVTVAELFLDRNQIVVTTKGRLRSQNIERRARISGPVNGVPLVVLINEGSASASEIVAGAIQDHGRGVIMGMKSHGKASVQTIFPLSDGSALRLTTSKYFTPSGRSIHGEGILPDVEVPFERRDADDDKDESEAEQIFERIENGQTEEELKSNTHRDSQLARAVDLLKGLRVYHDKEQSAQ